MYENLIPIKLNFFWTKQNSPPSTMSYNFAQATIGSLLSGRTFGAKNACGTIIHIFPGLGFEVKKDGYTYIIIDNFSEEEYEMRHFVDIPHPEHLYHTLSAETIAFWTEAGYKTKEKIYGKEVNSRRLLSFPDSKFINLPESPPPSPILPNLVVERLPLDFEKLCFEEDERPSRFADSVARLSKDELLEGIGAARWELRRLNNPHLKYHSGWLDAALKENELRNKWQTI